MIPIYTIGYGNRPIDTFIDILKRYDITFLVDIRSQPYSRYHPDYSKDALEKHLKQHSIKYIFMGDTLGGRPNDRSCYVDDKVDYALVREKPFFQRGIRYLHTVYDKQLRIALMCSEAKPQECHRAKLIGNTLHEQHIQVAHIDEHGETRTQEQVNLLLTDGQLSLFDSTMNPKTGISRKKYAAREDEEQ